MCSCYDRRHVERACHRREKSAARLNVHRSRCNKMCAMKRTHIEYWFALAMLTIVIGKMGVEFNVNAGINQYKLLKNPPARGGRGRRSGG